MPEKIIARYRIVTPMFIGDANQEANGISSGAVKGALRFWWRALNWGACLAAVNNNDEAEALRELHKREKKIFGGTAKMDNGVQTGGQGIFLLRVSHDELNSTNKAEVHSEFKNYPAARYLGYGLMLAFGSTKQNTRSGQLERSCLNENQYFTLELLFRGNIEPSVQNALIAWGLLGALGSRSRHGIGSVALVSLKNNHGEEQYPLPMNEGDYSEQIKKLFSSLPATEPPFSAFWQKSRIDRLLSGKGCYIALEQFGKAMMMYRSWGRSNGNGGSTVLNKTSERRFKDDHDWFKVKGWAEKHPDFHPKRVVFGLPHNYQKKGHHVISEKYKRRSSPLLFHVHPVGDKFVGISIFLPANFLPDNEKIKANNIAIPANVTWSVITGFLDGKVGHPSGPNALARFPDKVAVLP